MIRRRSLPFPTVFGWALLLLVACAPAVWWWFCAESFLAVTDESSGGILVVESWIGNQGIRSAARDFSSGQFDVVVMTGGLSSSRWNDHPISLAAMAAYAAVNAAVPRDQIIVANADETDSQRTYAMAFATKRELASRGLQPNAITVFTMGVHARRSRLVFSKVFGPSVSVGVVAWRPPEFYQGPWWRSTERAENLLKESIAFPFELLFNAAR